MLVKSILVGLAKLQYHIHVLASMIFLNDFNTHVQIYVVNPFFFFQFFMSFILVHYNGCCAISCGPYRNNYTCINVYIHENKMVIILIIIIILYFLYCSVY